MKRQLNLPTDHQYLLSRQMFSDFTPFAAELMIFLVDDDFIFRGNWSFFFHFWVQIVVIPVTVRSVEKEK